MVRQISTSIISSKSLQITFTLFLIFLSTCSVESQIIYHPVDESATCSPYIGGSPCTNRLWDPSNIYSQPNYTQSQRLYKASTVVFAMQTIKECNTDGSKNGICNDYLPDCVQPVGLTKNISLAAQVCRQSCEELVTSCPEAAALVNCNNYPTNYTYYNLTDYGGSDAYLVPCINISLINNTVSTDYCPAPLLNFPDRFNNSKYAGADSGYNFVADSTCAVQCPIPIFTESQWSKLYLQSTIMSSVSFVCTSYMLVTFGILAVKYNRFTISMIFFSGCIWIMNITDIISAGVGHRKMFCPEPGRVGREYDAGCVITGTLFQFAIVGALLWWTIMSVQLYMAIRRVDIKYLKSRWVIVATLVIQIILIIIPLSTKSVKAGNAALACWLVGTWTQNGLFWIPLSVCLFIGTLAILLVIKEVYQIARKVHQDHRFIKMQIRPLLCVALIAGSFTYATVTHFYFDAHDSIYKANIPAYMKCLQEKNGDTSGPECTINGPPFLRYYFFYFVIRMFGIFVFLLYGLTIKAKKIWIAFVLRHTILNRLVGMVGISFKSPTQTTAGAGYTGDSNGKHRTNNSSAYNTSFSNSFDSRNNNNSIITEDIESKDGEIELSNLPK